MWGIEKLLWGKFTSSFYKPITFLKSNPGSLSKEYEIVFINLVDFCNLV